MADRKIEVVIAGDSKSLERAFARAGKSSKGFASTIGISSRSLAKGIAATTAAVTALGVVGSKSFARFQHTLSQTVGLAGDSRKAVQGFSKELLRLGPEVAKSPTELADALYFVASAGIAVDKQMSVVTASAKASAAGLGETSQVADAVTSAMNAYGASVVSASEATDVLVNTVKFGKGEAAAFAPVIGTVASLAAQLGVRFEEVGAALAAQTRLGTSAETAAIQLQATFSSLLKTTPQQAKALASVGLSAEGLRDELKKKGLLAVLETLKKSFGDNTAAMAEAFPNIRALRGLLSLVGKSADSTREVFDGMRDSTGALASAFDAVSKDEAFRFNQTLAALQATGIRLGAIFSPLANVIARAATAALEVVGEFLDKLSEAHTIRAKIAVIWEGVEEAASGAQDLLTKAIQKIDFAQVFEGAQGIADGLQKRLEEVDFSIVGKKIGDAFVQAVDVAIPAAKDLATRINKAVRTIDFEALGRQLGPALAAAVVSAFVTLTDPAFWIRNWDLALAVAFTVFGGSIGRVAGKLAAPLARLGEGIVLRIGVGLLDAFPRLGALLIAGLSRLPGLVARALAPLTGLVSRVFGRLGRLSQFVLKVIGITAAINAIVGFARKVGAVFANIGHTIGEKFNAIWEGIEKRALRAALKIIEPFTHIPGFLGGGAFQRLKEQWSQTLATMEGDTTGTVRAIQSSINTIKGKDVVISISTKVTNAATLGANDAAATASDNAVGNLAIATAKKQAAAEQSGAEAIAKQRQAQAAATKRAAATAKKAKAQAVKAFGELIDSLGLKADAAAQTKSLRDDIRVQQDVLKAIAAEIKIEGKTTDLLRQRLEAQNQIADLQRQIIERQAAARKGRQFEALGLTSTGDKPTPGVGALTKRLGTLREQIKGTILDTPKTRAELARIGKVLAGRFGKVGKDVRAAILQMFSDISGALSQGGKKTGPLTKTQALRTKNIIADAGLSGTQARLIQSRLSRFNTAGVALAKFPQTATTGGFRGEPLNIDLNATLLVDGHKLTTVVTKQQQKTKRRNPRQKRGPNRGD